MNLPKISNCLVEPYYPYSWPYLVKPYETWIGDFPPLEDKKRKDDLQKGWIEALKKFSNPITATESIFDKQVWFNNADGNGQTFRLEVVGYGPEHLSVGASGDILKISGKNGQKSFNQQYQIPSPEKLDFEKVSVKVEHGLLEIVFSAKKTEVKSVKIL